MLKSQDLLLLLSELRKNGVDVKEPLLQVTKLQMSGSDSIPVNVIKFINDNRPLEITKFYEQLRKSYNAKRSSLYSNIVREIKDPSSVNPLDVLTTLSSLNLQILLFAKHLEGKEATMFLSHSRGEEITRVLNNYYVTYDLEPCVKLLELVRSDCKVFQSIK